MKTQFTHLCRNVWDCGTHVWFILRKRVYFWEYWFVRSYVKDINLVFLRLFRISINSLLPTVRMDWSLPFLFGCNIFSFYKSIFIQFQTMFVFRVVLLKHFMSYNIPNKPSLSYNFNGHGGIESTFISALNQNVLNNPHGKYHYALTQRV